MISSNKKFTTQFLNSADLSDFFGLVSNKVLKPIIPLLLVSLFQQTETLQETLSTLIQNWQALDDRSAHIKSLLLLSAVFQSKPAAGSAIFLKEGIIDNLIELLEFSKPDVQVAALEVLSISCSDKLSRNLVCAKCTPLLQILSKSDNSDVKSGAISTLIKSMIDDKETEKKVLQDVGIIDNLILNVQSSLNGGLGHDIESLAFLSVQPEIKEKMVGDQKFLVSLFQYNSNDRTILFGISTILFNLTRFSKKLTEEEEQIQKLRQMTKDIPKVSSDERNSDNAVFIRCSKLIKSGIVPFLVYLSKSDSINIKDTVAQIFHSLVSKPENRGVIIQQGGVKSLIQLSSNCSNEFIPLATQSLAKITITADPNIAFKGETVNELIRPFISLLNGDDQLRQFEGLMALTNLASIGPQVRQLIIKNQGVKAFEMLQFSSNEMVQRAATEAMCNMMFEQQVFESFSNASTSSRLLIFIALCGSEDLATRRAASGVVAILSSDENACRLIQKEEKGLPILAELLEDDSIEILHRALECVKNMVLFGGEVKRAVVLSGCIEIVRKMKTNVDILIGLKKEILDSV